LGETSFIRKKEGKEEEQGGKYRKGKREEVDRW
jgi:hypothetical protein